jgi:hypothetical protein
MSVQLTSTTVIHTTTLGPALNDPRFLGWYIQQVDHVRCKEYLHHPKSLIARSGVDRLGWKTDLINNKQIRSMLRLRRNHMHHHLDILRRKLSDRRCIGFAEPLVGFAETVPILLLIAIEGGSIGTCLTMSIFNQFPIGINDQAYEQILCASNWTANTIYRNVVTTSSCTFALRTSGTRGFF